LEVYVASERWLLLQHLLHVEGGQFAPESPGQFAPELVVSLPRNQVVWFIRISSLKVLLIILNALLVTKNQTHENSIVIGKPFPDVKIDNVYNWKSESFHLSDFEGKIVIMDQWSFTYEPCLRALSRLDSLQNRFGDKIQIIMVCRESKERLPAFFNTHHLVKLGSLPNIANDKMFHQSIAEAENGSLWIGKTGKVLFKGATFDITQNNIDSVLNNENFKTFVQPKTTYLNSPFDPKIRDEITCSSTIINTMVKKMYDWKKYLKDLKALQMQVTFYSYIKGLISIPVKNKYFLSPFICYFRS
jgi:hypothetical protein